VAALPASPAHLLLRRSHTAAGSYFVIHEESVIAVVLLLISAPAPVCARPSTYAIVQKAPKFEYRIYDLALL